MVKTALVEKDIEAGKRLIEALDQAGFDVRAAYWFYLSDLDSWRLMVASPIVPQKGPLAAYTLIQSVLARQSPPIELAFTDISVISPTDEIVRLLGTAMKTGPGLHGIRFTRNAVNGIYIEDVYIYRVL